MWAVFCLNADKLHNSAFVQMHGYLVNLKNLQDYHGEAESKVFILDPIASEDKIADDAAGDGSYPPPMLRTHIPTQQAQVSVATGVNPVSTTVFSVRRPKQRRGGRDRLGDIEEILTYIA